MESEFDRVLAAIGALRRKDPLPPPPPRLDQRLALVQGALEARVSDRRLWQIPPVPRTARREALMRKAAAGQSVWVYGPVDTGKSTWAVQALRARLVAEAVRVTETERTHGDEDPLTGPDFASGVGFVFTDDLIRELQQEVATGERKLLEMTSSIDWLVLDDVGARAKFSPFVADEIASLIDKRYRAEKTTIFTANMTPDEFGNLIASSLASAAGKLVGERTASRIHGLLGGLKPSNFAEPDGPGRRNRR